MIKIPLATLRLEKITPKPGVYFFLDGRNRPLYIGKAANLRARLRSYFGGNQSEKISRLLSESKTLEVRPLESEIEAILKEAEFIRKIRPKYNVLLRDDKNYFFVAITREKLPRIFVTHQPRQIANAEFIGPFVNGRTLRHVLKLVREYFPYCTCRQPHSRLCLEAQLGNCPGYCCRSGSQPSKEDIAHYSANIREIKMLLQGKINPLKTSLRKRIEKAARLRQFELAAEYRRHYEGLEAISRHRGFIETFVLPEPAPDPGIRAMEHLAAELRLKEIPERIEVYDVSMISGANAVGAMTVFIAGKPARSEWRLFGIRKARSTDDPGMIAEVIDRRLKHPEWHLPDALIVDGGVGQLNAAVRAAGKLAKRFSVAAIAKGAGRKNDRLIFTSPTGGLKTLSFKRLSRELARFLAGARNETHRFALSYHRRRRKKQLIG